MNEKEKIFLQVWGISYSQVVANLSLNPHISRNDIKKMAEETAFLTIDEMKNNLTKIKNIANQTTLI